MNARDFIGEPCTCPECYQAGVTGEPTRRDPQTGVMLHGYGLRRWLDARQKFMDLARKSMHWPTSPLVHSDSDILGEHSDFLWSRSR